MDDMGDGAPMDETPSNTSLLSFDLGSGLTPKMSWLASRTRDGLGPSALQRQGSGGESLGSLPSRDLLANLTDPISPSVAPYLQSLMSPREARRTGLFPGVSTLWHVLSALLYGVVLTRATPGNKTGFWRTTAQLWSSVARPHGHISTEPVLRKDPRLCEMSSAMPTGS